MRLRRARTDGDSMILIDTGSHRLILDRGEPVYGPGSWVIDGGHFSVINLAESQAGPTRWMIYGESVAAAQWLEDLPLLRNTEFARRRDALAALEANLAACPFDGQTG